jgi:cytoskeletal protein CcmA (bactofilin family)
MGDTYTRQSSYTDGDVITASHTNDEFNQLLAAFASSSGHTHDGTAAEGGPITKLLGNSLTFGAGTAGTDITVTFDGETSDGVLKWMEDEDYFEFSDDILIASTEKLQFRDTAIYINSSADGQLDIVADTEVQIAATTVDINGAVDISGNLTVGGSVIIGGNTLSSTELLFLDGITAGTVTASKALVVDSNKDIASLRNITITGELDAATLDISGNADIDGTLETDALSIDGTTITATAAEINLIDGGATVGTTAIADGDGLIINDAGTMRVSTVQTLAAYLDDEITAMPNLVTTAATTVGALNSGSITSGFGTIDTGSSTITTTGLITGGSLDIDDVVINGTTIGHTDDTDLITLADGIATVAGEISVTTLDIGGTNVTSTATELNIMDGDTSASSTTLADADRIVVNDAGTMKQVALTDFETYFESALDTLSNVTTVGALNSGSITSGFGAIDVGSSNLTATGTISLGATSFNDNAITNVGDIALDSISADGTDINVAVSDNSATAFTIKQGSDNYLVIDTGNSSESVSIGTGVSGTAITLGHGTSEVTVGDNLTVTGDLTVSGTTTTVNSTTVNLNDHNIVLDSGNSTSAVINGAGITIEGGSGDDATFTYNTTGPQFELKLGSSFEDLQTAKLTATELDISGDADIDGTLEADAITVNGTALATVIAGTTVTNSTNAAHVTVADNENTNEENLITFIEDTSATGNVGLESDGDFTYNPSTGTVSATIFKGNIDAVDGDFDGTLETDALSIAGTTVTTTATELNIIDGDTSASATTLADADRFVTNDAGTMKQVALTDVKTYLTSAGFSTDDPTALAIALG